VAEPRNEKRPRKKVHFSIEDSCLLRRKIPSPRDLRASRRVESADLTNRETAKTNHRDIEQLLPPEAAGLRHRAATGEMRVKAFL
jgi:hypothetical protein